MTFLYLEILDLREAYEQCSSKPNPESSCPSKMYDVKEWLDPHSDDLHKHVKPHCFKFVRDNTNKAVMYYRKWSGEDWMGPVQLLKVIEYFLNSLPSEDLRIISIVQSGHIEVYSFVGQYVSNMPTRKAIIVCFCFYL